MKKLFTILFAVITAMNFAFSQGISINTTGATADPSAMLDVSGTNQGMLVPRMTETQKLAISNPANGLLIYQTNNSTGFWYFNGAVWIQAIGPSGTNGTNGATGVTGATGPIGGFLLTGNTGTSISNFIGTTDNASLRFNTNNTAQLIIDSLGKVGIGTMAPSPSAKLDVSSNTQGFAIPSMSETARNAIVNPAIGLQVFNLTTNCLNIWMGSYWKQLCGDCPFNRPIPGTNGPTCVGSTLNFTATTISGVTYQWTDPNGFTSTLQNPSISNATVAASGTYSLTASMNGCTSTPQTTFVTVNTVPGTPTAGNSGPVCVGAVLNLTASTISGATYNWTGPNSYSTTVQNPSITNAQLTNAGTYSITATMNGCVSTTGTTSVTINSTPATPGSITGSITPCANSTGNVYSITAVTGATSYNWTVPTGASITSNTGTSITVTFGNSSGIISVTASSPCGTSLAQSIIITLAGASPSSIGGLSLWYDANAITGVTNGNTISSWSDLSGNGRNATSTSWPTYITGSINNLPILRFATSQNISQSYNFTTPFTILYVARETSGARQRVLNSISNNWLLGWWSGAKGQAYFNGWISSSGSPAADNNVYLYTGMSDGSISTIFENGTQIYQNNGGVAGPNGITIDGASADNEPSTCDIAEIIIYNSVLSTVNRQAVEAYLKCKWGL